VRTIVDPGGKRRVHLIARHDGRFGYAEEFFSDDPEEQCWLPASGSRGLPVAICDSLETAEREARASIDWLRAISN